MSCALSRVADGPIKNFLSLLSASYLLDYRNSTEGDELQIFLAGNLDAMSPSGADGHHLRTDRRTGSDESVRILICGNGIAGYRVYDDVFLYALAPTRVIPYKVETLLSARCVHVINFNMGSKAQYPGVSSLLLS